MVQRHGMEHIKIIPLKSFQNKAIRVIKFNTLAYNELTNAYFKCNKILKLSDQYKLQVLNYIFQLVYFNIYEEIVSSLLFNNQIHCHACHNTRSMQQPNGYYTSEYI